MLLMTYSFDEKQNFDLIQEFLHNKFSSNYLQQCKDFFECGRKSTEISFLFLEKEMHIFYSIPKCDNYDVVYFDKPCNIKDFMLELYNMFNCNIDISAHISKMNFKNTEKFVKKFFPKNNQNIMAEIEKIMQDENFSPACSFYASPYTSKDIQFVFNTYDELQSSIFDVIDGNTENNFLPNFFYLVSLLLYGR